MQIIFTKQVPIRLYAVLKDITIIEPNKVVQIISIICQIRYLNVIFLELNTFKLVIHMCCNADNLLQRNKMLSNHLFRVVIQIIILQIRDVVKTLSFIKKEDLIVSVFILNYNTLTIVNNQILIICVHYVKIQLINIFQVAIVVHQDNMYRFQVLIENAKSFLMIMLAKR